MGIYRVIYSDFGIRVDMLMKQMEQFHQSRQASGN